MIGGSESAGGNSRGLKWQTRMRMRRRRKEQKRRRKEQRRMRRKGKKGRKKAGRQAKSEWDAFSLLMAATAFNGAYYVKA